uniref:Uncharacterized protein n=1 Tax=Arundo donax TaxID=35708 RepID=A0A0A9CBG2_ARUDO
MEGKIFRFLRLLGIPQITAWRSIPFSWVSSAHDIFPGQREGRRRRRRRWSIGPAFNKEGGGGALGCPQGKQGGCGGGESGLH